MAKKIKNKAEPVAKDKKKITDEELQKLWKESAYDDIKEQSEVFSSEHAQARAIVHLTESKNPEILTELKDHEVVMLSSLSVVGTKYNSKLIDEWINKFIRFRISLNREGRKEIVDIAKAKNQIMSSLGSLNPLKR